MNETHETLKDNHLKDSSADFVSLKIQKLTLALYLISNFLSDQDPLKWRLRDKSLAILARADLSALGQTTGDIGQLIALLEVALGAPGVSRMNFSLLKQEYEELRGRLLDLTDSTVKQSVAPLPGDQARLPLATTSLPPSPLPPKMAVNKDRSQDGRRQLILKFIKTNGWSSIKEVAATLPAVSTKTVQRELADLVQAGLLKREGDRRWSRYAVA